MKTPWKKVFTAAVIVSAAPASAMPVVFDFTGTVRSTWDSDFETGVEIYDAGPVGAAFSAQFIIDTDLFAPPVSSAAEYSDRINYSSQLGGAMVSSLVINGETVNLAPYSTNTAEVGFNDSRGVIDLGGGSMVLSPDAWGFGLRSEQITSIGRTGLLRIGVSFVADYDFADPAGGPGWFDFSPGIDLDSIATLPMVSTFVVPPSIYLSDYRYGCAERCLQNGVSSTELTISTISRTVASVPEPGSLGLLAMGLAGAWFTRRRQAQRV